MGILRKREENSESKLREFRDNLQKYSKESSVTLIPQVSRYLDGIIRGAVDNPFYADEMLIEVINKYFLTCSEREKDLTLYIQEVKNIFDQVYLNGKSSDFSTFSLFMKIFDSDGIYERNLFDINFYRLFDNLNYFYIVMDNIMSNNYALEKFEELLKFFSYIRRYFESGESFYFEVCSIVQSLNSGVILSEFIDDYKERLDKMDGIYGVDEVLLDKIHEKTVGAQGFLVSLDENIKEASKMLKVLKERMLSYSNDLSDINRKALTDYEAKILGKISELEEKLISSKDELSKYLLALENQARSEITSNKESIINDLRIEKSRIIDSLKEYENILSNLAIEKSSEITRLGGEQLGAMSDFIKNQPQLKEILESSISSKKIAEIIKMFKEIEASTKDTSLVGSSVVIPQGVYTGGKVDASALVSGSPSLIIPEIEIDNRVNKLLDKSISIDDRMKMIEEKIAFNKSNGVMYHKDIMYVIYYLMEGYSPYLYGPSGSGKTLLAKQVIELLGLNYIKMNYINEEYEIKGSDPFLGQWSKSLMYVAYKGGAGVLVDEMDNGRAQATMALGPFISASEDIYTFANGENVKMHPNFRLIATGNTRGEGPTENHPTRERIDEAIMQRFKPLKEIDYDEKLESTMLSSYKHWYSFIKQFRLAGQALNTDNTEITIKGAITTRDVAEIANTLKSGYANSQMIINADFIRAHSYDYLGSLSQELFKYYNMQGSKEEKKLFEVFQSEVNKLKRIR